MGILCIMQNTIIQSLILRLINVMRFAIVAPTVLAQVLIRILFHIAAHITATNLEK